MEAKLCLSRLESILVRHVLDHCLPDALNAEQGGKTISEGALRYLATHTKRLSDAFTHGREGLSQDYLADPDLRAAYLIQFTLMGAAKVIHCLGQSDELNVMPENKPLRILDLGCGPGTASLTASLYFSQKHPNLAVNITGVEANGAAASDAVALVKRLDNPRHFFEIKNEHISARSLGRILKGRRFDIIIAANLINEFPNENDAHAVCKHVINEHLDDGGVFIIIDPALRRSTRALMHLRDKLLHDATRSTQHAASRVIAPCLHQERCPMLAANERDWCHFYIEWERPELIRRLDETTGIDHTYLKMAYLIFQKVHHNESRITSHESRNTWRVVSSPLKSKGKIEIVLCGENGMLLRVTRLDRDASETNTAIDNVKRGDIVIYNGKKRVGKDEVLNIITWKSATAPSCSLEGG